MDNLNAKDFWNQRADHYDNSVNKTYADAYQKTIDLTKSYLKPEDHVLCFACGTGIVSNSIAGSVQTVTGIDISENMIAKAQHKAEQEGIDNISYAVANLEDDQIQSGNYTVITAFNVLYFLKDLDKKLKLIYNMLPENGYFLSVTDCVGKKKGFTHFYRNILMKLDLIPFINHMNVNELTAHIEKAGFKILFIENLHTEPPNLYVVAQKQS